MSTTTVASNSAAVPLMIRDRQPFNTYGALRGTKRDVFGAGRLAREHRALWERDRNDLTYVVWSYSTPIAWHTEEHGWYVPDQTFSATTSIKHQSKLYLIGPHWPVNSRAKSVKSTTFRARIHTECIGLGVVLLAGTSGRDGTYYLHKNFHGGELTPLMWADGTEVMVTINARDTIIRVAPVIEGATA